MNAVKWYKEAAKREAMVTRAKMKKVEELTKEEAIAIVQWDKEARRNTLIGLGIIWLGTTTFTKKHL